MKIIIGLAVLAVIGILLYVKFYETFQYSFVIKIVYNILLIICAWLFSKVTLLTGENSISLKICTMLTILFVLVLLECFLVQVFSCTSFKRIFILECVALILFIAMIAISFLVPLEIKIRNAEIALHLIERLELK